MQTTNRNARGESKAPVLDENSKFRVCNELVKYGLETNEASDLPTVGPGDAHQEGQRHEDVRTDLLKTNKLLRRFTHTTAITTPKTVCAVTVSSVN